MSIPTLALNIRGLALLGSASVELPRLLFLVAPLSVFPHRTQIISVPPSLSVAVLSLLTLSGQGRLAAVA